VDALTYAFGTVVRTGRERDHYLKFVTSDGEVKSILIYTCSEGREGNAESAEKKVNQNKSDAYEAKTNGKPTEKKRDNRMSTAGSAGKAMSNNKATIADKGGFNRPTSSDEARNSMAKDFDDFSKRMKSIDRIAATSKRIGGFNKSGSGGKAKYYRSKYSNHLTSISEDDEVEREE